MKVFIECIPPKSTAQQKGIRVIQPKGGGKAYAMHYRKKTVQAARDTFRALFAPHAPQSPLAGPLRVSLTFLYPFNKTERKSVVAAGFKWKDRRPDAGNTAKEPIDVLTELAFFEDDAQICDQSTRKAWCSKPGILLEIEQLDEKAPEDIVKMLDF